MRQKSVFITLSVIGLLCLRFYKVIFFCAVNIINQLQSITIKYNVTMLFLREGNQYYCLVKVDFFANKHSETLRENPFKRKLVPIYNP